MALDRTKPVGEMFYAVTDDGERHPCITKSRALTVLLQLRKPGRVICENNLSEDLPAEWVVISVDADGRLHTGANPVPAITYEE